MIWEIFRANLADSKGQESWGLTILDRQSAASLLAVAMGLTFARAQYASAVRPLITWSGNPRKNDFDMTSRYIWYVEMANGGTHNAVVYDISYRLKYLDGTASEWVDTRDRAAQLLGRLGLGSGTDFDLNTIKRGAVLGSALYIGRFSLDATRKMDEFELRVRVSDAVGDHHERTLACFSGAREEMPFALAGGPSDA
ncbi:hypothetical protein GCM10010278_84230 [Streptomyces melanogenes]|nr:hypothetical protein GCM10010278_84230 [Streptomyces melanogenes]